MALPAVKRLAAALRTCGLYDLSHPHTSMAIAQFVTAASRHLESHGSLEVDIGRSSFTVSASGMERTDAEVLPLVSILYARGIRRLSVLPGITAPEVRRLLEILISSPPAVRRLGGAEHLLRVGGAQHLGIREVTAPEEPHPRSAPDQRASEMAILRQFIAAARNIRLYRGGHLSVQASIDELFAALTKALAAGGSIRFALRDSAVIGAHDIMDADAVWVAAFASDCAARQVASLTFVRGLTRTELAQVVALFARAPEELVVEGGFVDALRALGVPHVSAVGADSA